MNTEVGVLTAIGDTPMVRLDRLFPAEGIEVWAKLESANPGGSVKDRPALGMILRAERRGELNGGDTIVEPTSGNMGIGLAIVAAVRGYRLVLTMPESMSEERTRLLRILGAEVHLTSAEDGMTGAVRAAEQMVARHGYFMPDQFANPANPAIHRRTTAQEILRDMDDPADYCLFGVGTGGTITGVGEVLKEHWEDVCVVGVEPEESPVLSGGESGSHGIQGIGAGFVPSILDQSLIDEVITVSEAQAWDYVHRLAETEGLLVGVSSGAAVAAVHALTERLSGVASPVRVVTLLPDTGERYLSLLQ